MAITCFLPVESCITIMVTRMHVNDQLPVIVLGGAGGRIRGGRVLDYAGKSQRQLCRLLLSLMDKMDIRPKTFGDANRRLEEI